MRWRNLKVGQHKNSHFDNKKSIFLNQYLFNTFYESSCMVHIHFCIDLFAKIGAKSVEIYFLQRIIAPHTLQLKAGNTTVAIAKVRLRLPIKFNIFLNTQIKIFSSRLFTLRYVSSLKKKYTKILYYKKNYGTSGNKLRKMSS